MVKKMKLTTLIVVLVFTLMSTISSFADTTSIEEHGKEHICIHTSEKNFDNNVTVRGYDCCNNPFPKTYTYNEIWCNICDDWLTTTCAESNHHDFTKYTITETRCGNCGRLW